MLGSPDAHDEKRPSTGAPPLATLQPFQNCTPLSGPPFQIQSPSVSASLAPIHTFLATVPSLPWILLATKSFSSELVMDVR